MNYEIAYDNIYFTSPSDRIKLETFINYTNINYTSEFTLEIKSIIKQVNQRV